MDKCFCCSNDDTKIIYTLECKHDICFFCLPRNKLNSYCPICNTTILDSDLLYLKFCYALSINNLTDATNIIEPVQQLYQIAKKVEQSLKIV